MTAVLTLVPQPNPRDLVAEGIIGEYLHKLTRASKSCSWRAPGALVSGNKINTTVVIFLLQVPADSASLQAEGRLAKEKRIRKRWNRRMRYGRFPL